MMRARNALLTLATGASLFSLVFAGACSGATPRDINDRDAESGFEPPAAANDAGDAGDASDIAGATGTAGSGGAAGSDGTAGAGASAGASGSGGAAGAVSDGGTGQ